MSGINGPVSPVQPQVYEPQNTRVSSPTVETTEQPPQDSPSTETQTEETAPLESEDLTGRYAQTESSPEAAEAAENILNYLADGDLSNAELDLIMQMPSEILDMLENGELEGLSTPEVQEVQEALNTEQGPDQGDRIAEGTRLSERITERDRATGRRSDVSHNFYFDNSVTPQQRQAEGFFAEQANYFFEQAQSYGSESPELGQLSESMGEMYRTLAGSTDYRQSQRAEIVSTMNDAIANTYATLSELPPGTLSDENRREILQNLSDLSSIVQYYDNYAGKDIGGFKAPTSLDRFTSSILQRQRQFEGTAVSGRRQTSERMPEGVSGALESLQADRESMQTIIGRNRALERNLYGDQYPTREAYVSEVLASAPETSASFRGSLTTLANAQYDAYLAQKRTEEGGVEAQRAVDTAGQALTSQLDAQNALLSADRDMALAQSKLAEYQELAAQSLGHSERAQALLAEAQSLEASARSRLGEVRNSAFGSALGPQALQVEQRLSQIAPLRAQIEADLAQAQSTRDVAAAGALETEAQIQAIQAEALAAAEQNPEDVENFEIDLDMEDFSSYISHLDSQGDSITVSLSAEAAAGLGALQGTVRGQFTAQITRLGDGKYAVQLLAEGQVGAQANLKAGSAGASLGAQAGVTYILDNATELNHFLIDSIREIPGIGRAMPNLDQAPDMSHIQGITRVGAFAQVNGRLELLGTELSGSGRAQVNTLYYPNGQEGTQQILAGGFSAKFGRVTVSGDVTRSSLVNSPRQQDNGQRLEARLQLSIPLTGGPGSIASDLRSYGSRMQLSGPALESFVAEGERAARSSGSRSSVQIMVYARYDVNTDQANLLDDPLAPVGDLVDLRVGAGLSAGVSAEFDGVIVSAKAEAGVSYIDYTDNLVR